MIGWRIHIGIGLLIIYSCANTSAPDTISNLPVIESSEALNIVKEQLLTIGVEAEDNNIMSHNKIEHGWYEVSRQMKDDIIFEANITYQFTNDSICSTTYQEIKKYFDHKGGVSKGSSTFSSWELPSQRNYLTKVLLANKSNIYNQPSIEITLIENEDRLYRK